MAEVDIPGVEARPAHRCRTGSSLSRRETRTDNCQSNELDAYIALLDGGEVVSTDSGELGHYDGVGSLEHFDPRYWHPDGSPDQIDLPRRIHGFPLVPGLLVAAIVPFAASGLPLPWYAVYGNHDALLGGTLYPNDVLAGVAVGG